MPPVVVLNVSTDPPLLKTRSLLLRGAGYTVVEHLSLKEAASELLSSDFDAVLLCHTITDDQRDRLINLIRDRNQSTQVLMISDRLGERDQRVDATLQNDPEELLGGLAAVLRRWRHSVRAMRKQA